VANVSRFYLNFTVLNFKMAKKEETSKAILERIYVIPLRRETLKVPNFKKANKAMRAVKEFIAKHMKTEDIHVGKYLNLKIWSHGAKNPPGKVKVNAAKDGKGKVVVELFDAPKEKPEVEEMKKPVKGEKEAKLEKAEEKIEKKLEETKESRAEEAKKIEQEEIKELKKEHPKQHAPKMQSQPKVQQAHPTAPRSV